MVSKHIPPFAMLVMAVILVLSGGGGYAESSTKVSTLSSISSVSGDLEKNELEPPQEKIADPEVEIEEETPEIVESDPWADLPNVCETFSAHQGVPKHNKRKGRRVAQINYRRNRYAYTISDQKRTKEIIRLVAREMGVAEPDFFVAMAAHESSFHPEAIHILNEDLAANKKSWERHNYTAAREASLRAKLSQSSARGDGFWKTKSTLSTLLTYKDNPHWNTRIEYDLVVPGRTLRDGTTTPSTTVRGTKSVWSLGYGLYGHNAVLYTKTWSPSAPPWVLCAHQGIIDTIVEVWVARAAARECEQLSSSNPAKYGHDGDSYLGTLRRLATGRCSAKPLKRQWQHLLAEYGDPRGRSVRGGSVPWGRSADFGKKWPSTSDRGVVLAHMLRRAEEEGLLRPAPLRRKKSGSEPVIVARR